MGKRFRFTQGATLGDNSGAAFLAGGGVDYKIGGGRLYWRVQGDFIGTNIGPSISANYSFLSEQIRFSTLKRRNSFFFIGRQIARSLRSTPAFYFVARQNSP